MQSKLQQRGVFFPPHRYTRLLRSQACFRIKLTHFQGQFDEFWFTEKRSRVETEEIVEEFLVATLVSHTFIDSKMLNADRFIFTQGLKMIGHLIGYRCCQLSSIVVENKFKLLLLWVVWVFFFYRFEHPQTLKGSENTIHSFIHFC